MRSRLSDVDADGLTRSYSCCGKSPSDGFDIVLKTLIGNDEIPGPESGLVSKVIGNMVQQIRNVHGHPRTGHM